MKELNEDLLNGARKVMECGDVKQGERVVIVTDTCEPPEIGLAMIEAANEFGATSVLLTMNPVSPGGDLPFVIDEALKNADYIITPTTTSIYHSHGMHVAHEEPYNARAVALSECTMDMVMAGGITADFKKIRPVVHEIGEVFTKGKKIKFTTPAGTCLEASIEGRDGYCNTGIADMPGMLEGMPTIEVFIAPVEESVNGVIVCDASCSGGIGVIKEPIILTIENGIATKIEGGEQARKLSEIVEAVGMPNAYQIAEMAIGLNPKSRITGFINEDEGKYGTCHCAIGSNAGFGGLNDVPLHIDMVQYNPTVLIDDIVVEKDGELIIAELPDSI